MFLVPLVTLLMGFFSLKVGLRFLKGYQRLKTESCEVVVGTITDIVEVADRSAEGTSYSYHPVVRFMYRGAEHSVQTEIGVRRRKRGKRANGKRFAVGDIVNVRIDRGDVSTATINIKAILGFAVRMGVFLSAIGVSLLFLGLLLVTTLL